MKLPAYPRYKPSGVEWLGDVPEHWEVKRLKTSARCWVSNVDKVPAEDELPVRLCNYTDVYYHEEITADMELMETTATAEEIERFALLEGDVVITKDSEDWRDIAVPALVKKSAPDLVCGYHLGIIRSRPKVLFGDYLLRAFQSCAVNQQFQVAASGVTRYGLPKASIGGAWIPIPATDEQRAIAAFLDRETGRVGRLVAKKQELIERLKEKRTAVISRTVTRGLQPIAAGAAGLLENPPLKPSGLDWLGDIPAHWEVRKFSREVAIAEGQVDPEVEPYASMLLIGPEHVESATGRLLRRATAADQAAESGKYFSRKGDVIYSKIRPALRKLVIAPEDCLCSADMYPLRARKRLDNRFILWLFLSKQFLGWSVLESDRVAMPKINRDTLNELRMPVPPLPEQAVIAEFLKGETATLDAMIEKVNEAVERLQEYRTALITAAVTGKVDVRTRVTHVREE